MFEPASIPSSVSESEGQSGFDSQITAENVQLQAGGELCVHELVARQAAATPNALAIADDAESLTYGQLNDRANLLAGNLLEAGVRPDEAVGLCLERSVGFIVAALAVLKAGGAYVPLDPAAPAERQSLILRNAQVAIVIANGAASSVPAGPWHVLDPHSRLSNAVTDFPVVAASHLAYVIYTSGSTGQPKGVEISHGSLANLIAWHNAEFQVSPADRASHQAALGFDAAVWEIWPYLATGASVQIPSESVRNNPESLRDWLVERRVTITFLPTALAERMMQMAWPAITSLRILLTGADTLHRRPSADLPFAVVNNYGPTEFTVVATSGRVAVEDGSKSLPSIGRPIANARVYVLDESGHAVANGDAGEIYLAGAGVARGYRNLPQMTAERFVASSFVPGERLYRTGDLGRHLPNGEVEFIGRIDDQIKIRGYRVEPNEIVAVLDRHAAVHASVVVARQENGGEKRLLAYVVPAEGATSTASDLREHLRKHLPDFMIPALFVTLPALPVTANGKVDNTALPAPEAANLMQDGGFVAPAGMVEQYLAPIVAGLLHVERIGSGDNFFLLGGHSLLGTQLLTKINDSFGVDLSLLQLFDNPTLGGMSAEIEKLILAKIESGNASEESTL